MSLKALYIASIGLSAIGGACVGGYYLFRSQPSKNDSQGAQLPKGQETDDLNAQKLQTSEVTDNRSSSAEGVASNTNQRQPLTGSPAATQSPETGRSEGGAQGPSR